MKDKILNILSGRIFEYGVIHTDGIRFEEEVIRACAQNTCGKYNACWTCPPANGGLSTASKITQYPYALVFTTKHDLEDSYDYPGMMDAKAAHDVLTRELHEAVGSECPVFGAGGCTLCQPCAYPNPCVQPDRIFPSIEGCGINVTALSRSAKVNYINGENTITYFSMVLFR